MIIIQGIGPSVARFALPTDLLELCLLHTMLPSFGEKPETVRKVITNACTSDAEALRSSFGNQPAADELVKKQIDEVMSRYVKALQQAKTGGPQ